MKKFNVLISGIFFISCSQSEHKSPCVNPRDYQIECFNDSTVLFDGERRVGVAFYKNSPIDQIINHDNE